MTKKESLTKKLGFVVAKKESFQLKNDKKYQTLKKDCQKTIAKLSKKVKLPVFKKDWWQKMDKDYKEIEKEKEKSKQLLKELADIKKNDPIDVLLSGFAKKYLKPRREIVETKESFIRFLRQKSVEAADKVRRKYVN